jgi:DNA-binding CsgD family transcriptional regulator
MTGPTIDRHTGTAAVAGGLLLAASVGAELVHPVQEPDGSVVSPVLFAVYLGAWILGAAALVVAQLGLRSTAALPAAGRAGALVCLIGTGLLLAFGLVVVASALATGTPLEASFLAFAIGLLLVAVGSVLLGLGLRRSGAVGGWWTVLFIAAAGATTAVDRLTDREVEVLRLLAEGLSNAEIAQRLFVSSATVKCHVAQVLRKLGVRDRVQAVVTAFRSGLGG